MEIGIYFNNNGEILGSGTRKIIFKKGEKTYNDPEGLTFAVPPAGVPENLKIYGHGVIMWLYKTKKIVENPAYITAKENAEAKATTLEAAILNSPLHGLSIAEGEKFVEDNTAKVVQKAMLPFILKVS